MNKRLKFILIIAGSLALLIVILFQAGMFVSGRIAPGNKKLTDKSVIKGTRTVIKKSVIPELYYAVGTIHSRTEVELSSRITARVIEVKKRSGDKAAKGEVLIELDKRDLQAILTQAEKRVKEVQSGIQAADQGVKEADAAFKLAQENYKRDKLLFSKGVIPQKALDRSTSIKDQTSSALAQAKQRKLQAMAALEAAHGMVKEVTAKLEYATIRSPFDGIVGKQLADPGDLASPGIILMTVFDPTRIMFYVPIRESLVEKVQIGDKLFINVPAINKEVEGVIREIVPSVDSGSRTFLVKICILKNEDLMPGMFATLKLRIGTKKVILIPQKAIKRIGQLEYVTVIGKGDKAEKKLIRTVPYKDDTVIVISGLHPGEIVISEK